MSIIINKINALITGQTDRERLAQIAEQIAATEAQLQQLEERRRNFIVAALSENAAAGRIVKDAKRDAEALQERLTDLRQAKAQIEAALARARREADESERRESLRRIARARRQLFHRAARIDATGAALARECKAALADAQELGAVSGSVRLRRWDGETLHHNIRNALAPLFDIDPAAPKRIENNMLGLVSSWVGARAHFSLSQFIGEMLDAEAPVFDDEAAAGACCAGRPEGTAFVAPLEGGLWIVVANGQAFPTRSAAEAAMRTVSMFGDGNHVVTPWRDAFLILPKNIAAALTLPAAAPPAPRLALPAPTVALPAPAGAA